ncbi:GDP-mannose mannosyl hydrolase, partial [Salmonella enterica subsp. enterica]|nr:GDP-mannose mannosyl hydrolase [Salmonella enterica subsp. enterica]
MFIPSDKFREVIKLTPLVSIDILIENENGEYLFGLRNNRPAKNQFFVPGG